MKLFIFSSLLLCAPMCINSANILGIFMMPGYSQFTLGISLMKELARKGHEVTFISPMPQKIPVKNIKDISVAELKTDFDAIRPQLYSKESSSFIMKIYSVSQMGISFTEKILKHENVQQLLKSDKKFDLVIMEHFWNDALMSFATHFNCPLVMVFSMPASSWINHLVANPGPPSYIPNLHSKFTDKMTFMQRQAILNAFTKMKTKILWKFEIVLSDIPPNVKIQQWLPQQDVLAHKNVKAFISHGGLLSTTEAIYFGKPIIGIPIFGDQKMNINIAVSNGYAIRIPYSELTEDILLKAMNDILNNQKYSNEAQRRSKLMHDRPLKPMDEAIYWIEYVIRHKGAAHLQSAAIFLKWYQVNLLDVYGFIIFVCLISCFFLVKLLQLFKVKKNIKNKNLIKKSK